MRSPFVQSWASRAWSVFLVVFAIICYSLVTYLPLAYNATFNAVQNVYDVWLPQVRHTLRPSNLWAAFQPAYVCEDPKYSVRILSYDPLMIYLENFITENERRHLLTLASVAPTRDLSFTPYAMTKNIQ